MTEPKNFERNTATAAQINDICTGKREAKFGEYANICRALQVNFDKFIE